MKLSTNQVSTSPKAEGTGKRGSGGTVGGVSLPQHGGEGGDKYKGQKSDMSLPQHGGEGGGKEGKVASGSDQTLLLKKPNEGYNGPGRFLGKA